MPEETQHHQDPATSGTDDNQDPKKGGTDPKEDLLSRVTSFKKDSSKGENVDDIDPNFDISELEKKIESTEDPQAKELFQKMKKSLERAAHDKYQRIAEKSKELDKRLASIEQQGSNGTFNQGPWTEEKIQELLKDPTFIQSAQKLASQGGGQINPGGYTESEWEDFSPQQRAQINMLQQKVQELETKNQETEKRNEEALRRQQEIELNRRHEELKQRYSNYNPDEINSIMLDLKAGKVQGGPEHIYKAWKHDENVQAAYEMGRRDEREGINSNVKSSSVEGSTVNQNERLEPKEGEDSKSFWQRIVSKNLSQKS